MNKLDTPPQYSDKSEEETDEMLNMKFNGLYPYEKLPFKDVQPSPKKITNSWKLQHNKYEESKESPSKKAGPYTLSGAMKNLLG